MHYYIEDVNVKESIPTMYNHSIQFDLIGPDKVYINIDQPKLGKPSGKNATRASLIVYRELLESMAKWLLEQKEEATSSEVAS